MAGNGVESVLIESYPGQYLPRCLPRVLIFPQITRQDQSTLKPMDSVRALGVLLAQSAPQLFDRSTMAAHLELLKKLLQQTETYELNAGTDLYREPAKLIDLYTRSTRSEKLPRIVIELTNRCNLSCGHCFDERHAATGDLSLEVLEKVLREGKSCGIEQVSFTGGEPTIHRRFREIIERVCRGWLSVQLCQ